MEGLFHIHLECMLLLVSELKSYLLHACPTLFGFIHVSVGILYHAMLLFQSLHHSLLIYHSLAGLYNFYT